MFHTHALSLNLKILPCDQAFGKGSSLQLEKVITFMFVVIICMSNRPSAFRPLSAMLYQFHSCQLSESGNRDTNLCARNSRKFARPHLVRPTRLCSVGKNVARISGRSGQSFGLTILPGLTGRGGASLGGEPGLASFRGGKVPYS
jgi:hypothetical protein